MLRKLWRLFEARALAHSQRERYRIARRMIQEYRYYQLTGKRLDDSASSGTND